MPHLMIEVSDNLRQPLAQAGLLAAAHHALLDSGVFDGPDVKSRLVWRDEFLVGRTGTAEGFVHASLELLSGRTDAQRRQLSDAVVQALVARLSQGLGVPVQVSCDVRDMNRDAYAKAIHTD